MGTGSHAGPTGPAKRSPYAHRDTGGEVLLAACATENEGAGVDWAPTGERRVGVPASARDANGRVVLGVIRADGTLRTSRLAAPDFRFPEDA
ncbi:hypothetical protein [Streptomyces sp. NPDC057438]|uniref:hypothetical protein n=1 Tax=Streptomyces sp. NPDC057438 TaxID=3346133 RepID=UPI00368BDE1C